MRACRRRFETGICGILVAASEQAHRLYWRRGGTRAIVLPDFLVGAHAAVTGMPLLTRDRRRFDAYFNGLEIVAPT